ncbi:MAG: MFS transporter [Catenulispora sp.]|nr:MFS transporter [Catenulispora sp.]
MDAGVPSPAVVVRPVAARSRRELLAASVGGLVETFDWALYGVLAPKFAEQIFPSHDHTSAVIKAYASFAVGFLFRPVGGMLLGRLADRRGRRYALTFSIALMTLASTVLAIVPDHRTLGVGAAVVFLLARSVQGLSAGGEAPAVAAYLAEMAPPGRRYLYSGLAYAGLIVGSMLAFAVLGVLSVTLGAHGLANGGWRIGFAVCAALGGTGLWIRRTAPESEEFVRYAASGRRPRAWPVLSAHRRVSLAVFLITVGGTVGFYLGTLYLPQYAHHLNVTSTAKASGQIEVALVVLIGAMAAFGRFADRFDALTVVRVAVVIQALATVPLMLALGAKTLPFALVATVYLILLAPSLGIGYVLGAQLFPVEVRSLGFGVPGAVAGAIFGGTFPAVAEALWKAHHIRAVPWYTAACAALAVLGLALIRHEDIYRTGVDAASPQDRADLADSSAVSP